MKHTLLKFLFTFALFLFWIVPAHATNNVVFTGDVTFQLLSADTARADTFRAINGSQAVSMTIESTYIDITMEAGSIMNFSMIGTSNFAIELITGTVTDYRVVETCPITDMTLNAYNDIVLRLKINEAPGCVSSPTTSPHVGGPSAIYPPINYSVNINDGDVSTTSRDVKLLLKSDRASQVIVSNNELFQGAVWEIFRNGMIKDWKLEDVSGTKTVYVRYKSASSIASAVVVDSIVYNPNAESTEASSMPPQNYSIVINSDDDTTSSREVRLELISEHADFVLISNNQEFEDATWQPFSSPTSASWRLSEGDGMKVVYVKFRNQGVFLSQVVSDSINLIEKETEVPVAGVSDIPKAQAAEKETVKEGKTVCDTGCDKVSYELYIKNPDGTVRDTNGKFAKIQDVKPGIRKVMFEDKGADMDFKDLIFLVDKTDCKVIKVTLQEVNAGWHHQIGIRLLYGTEKRADILLGSDSHKMAGKTSIIKLDDYQNVCVEKSLEKEPVVSEITPVDKEKEPETTSCKSSITFTENMSIGNRSSQIAEMQKVLHCLGHFPDNIDFTGYYGQVSADAVRKFQADKGISQVGFVGPGTREALNSLEAKVEKPVPEQPKEEPKVEKPKVEEPVPEIAPAKVAPSSSCKASIIFDQYLGLGTVSEQVKPMQELLKCLGHFPEDIDATGYYGNVTVESVRKFQADKGISQVGFVGPGTREALNSFGMKAEEPKAEPKVEKPKVEEPVPEIVPAQVAPSSSCKASIIFDQYLGLGTVSAQVKPMQELLKCLGHFPADIDATGYYGNVTVESVRKFQADKGISQVGFVGHGTREALNSFGIKAEEPKAEEPKAEEPKVEEPKKEETPEPAKPVVDKTGCKAAITFIGDMELWETSDETKELQTVLKCLGHLESDFTITGEYSVETVFAVRKFQEEMGLKIVGTVGPSTLEKLNAL